MKHLNSLHSAELHRYFGVQKHPFDRFPDENNAFPSDDGAVPGIFGDSQEVSLKTVRGGSWRGRPFVKSSLKLIVQPLN